MNTVRSKENDSINISELLGKLIKFDSKEGNYVMDETISSFLYYMFPRDLFIRALSLLESHDMFIYVLEVEYSPIAEHMPTLKDNESSSSTIRRESSASNTTDKGTSTREVDLPLQTNLIGKFYQESLYELDFLFKLIVKNQSELVDTANPSSNSLIYVDILHWTCSCQEFTEEISKQIECHQKSNTTSKPAIKDFVLTEVDDIDKFSNDKFCQLDSYSLSKQRYFKYDKVMCPHLLAYAILLVSNKDVLTYFTQQEKNVLLLSINSINEWLKLHINIIV
ncbi:suppressor of hydroxyurea sensitivity protein 2 [Monosporozyma unispora]